MTGEQGAYGATFGTRFHLSSAPMLAVSTANQLQVAVTELRSNGMPELPLPIPAEEAFSIHLHLRETDNGSLWVRGQLVAEGKLCSGSACISDLEKPPVLYLPERYNFLQFYIPRKALNGFCHENGLEPIADLQWGRKDADETLHSLGLALLPALRNPHSSSQLFVDQIGLGIMEGSSQKRPPCGVDWLRGKSVELRSFWKRIYKPTLLSIPWLPNANYLLVISPARSGRLLDSPLIVGSSNVESIWQRPISCIQIFHSLTLHFVAAFRINLP
jgi:hypothetical protein